MTTTPASRCATSIDSLRQSRPAGLHRHPRAGPAQARTQQFVYDPAGRQVGRRVGPANTIATAAWACTAYDNRGRMTSQSWPATGPAGPARTATYTYAVGNNPLMSSVTDRASASDVTSTPLRYYARTNLTWTLTTSP